MSSRGAFPAGAAVPSAARRLFLGQAGLGIAAAVAAAMGVRVRGLVALPPRVSGALPAALAAPDTGWQVDDMWGPRYAHPVPYMHAAAAPDLSRLAADVDRQFVI